MNKNILFIAIALLLGVFIIFKMKGDAPVATESTLPAMPTPPACEETKQVEVKEEAKAEQVQPATEQKSDEPQMTQEEFEKLIADLVKAAEEEKKAKESASQKQPEQQVAPVAEQASGK